MCTQAELKRLFLDLTAGLLQNSSEITATRVVGRNTASDGTDIPRYIWIVIRLYAHAAQTSPQYAVVPLP